MVNNKIAQRAVAAGLSGLMAFGAAAPAALATGISWKDFDYYKTDNADDGTYWKRLGGKDRYETMKKIVEAYNETEKGFGFTLLGGKTSTSVYNYHSTVVLASGDNFPDALAANGLAGYLTNEQLTNGGARNTNYAVPVILTKAGSLTAEAKDLLKEMQVQNVIIMGGTAAVSQDVEDAINKMGIGTQRVAGADRQETSLKALQRINGNWKDRKGTYDLIIATGDNYADALSISPYAYRMGVPIILTKKDGTLTDAQVEAIKANDEIKEIVIVGGTSAVSDTVMGQIGTLKNNKMGVHYTRLAGVDRYETSAKIAEFEIATWASYYNDVFKNFKNRYPDYKGSIWSWLGIEDGFSFNHAIVATGENFPDALAGGQLAGGIGDPEDYLNVKDFELWSPCPLLLVKDGNTQAERIIESKMREGRTNVLTDTYATFKSFVKKAAALYGSDIINDVDFDYDKLNWDLYGSYFWDGTGTVNGYAYNMSETSFPFWVSLQALADASTKDATYYARVFDSFEYRVINQTAGSSTTPTSPTTAPQIEIVKASEYIDASQPVSAREDRSGNVEFTLKLKTTPTNVNYDSDDATTAQPITEIKIWVSADANPLDLGNHTATLGETYKYINGYGQVAYRDADKHFVKVETKAGQIKWKDVIRKVNASRDFYGIILGGTSAVSNDKKDDLDTAVRNATGIDNESLDSVVLNGDMDDDWGINITFSKLKNVYRKLTNKVQVACLGLNNNEIVSAKGAAYGDVYAVAGTSGYVVRVSNQNTGRVLGYIYYANEAAYKADWE